MDLTSRDVHEELEVASLPDSSHEQPISAFYSDPPNSKLVRHARSGAMRNGRTVARINNFMMSPPSSAGSHGSAVPVGSALHAARAVNSLRDR